MSHPRVSVFCVYADSIQRRCALTKAEVGSPERYLLFGLDEFPRYGLIPQHNLDSRRPTVVARAAAAALNTILSALGGYGGDFAAVWRCRRRADAADVIFSTVDRVGIPLVLMRYFRLVHRPIVYVSVGLPERIARLKSGPVRSLYRRAFRRVERIVCYGFEEACWLRAWLDSDDGHVRFIPLGVNPDQFRPVTGAAAATDVVAVGRDDQRDFALLVEVARQHPELSIQIVTGRERAQTLPGVPPNVEVLTDISLARVRDCLARARIVVLPLKPNSYSGATTTLLQAMAMGKPLVVSAVGAIADGYHLEKDVNCVLVPPGDAHRLEESIVRLLAEPEVAEALGRTARRTVVEHHRWDQYVASMARALSEAAG